MSLFLIRYVLDCGKRLALKRSLERCWGYGFPLQVSAHLIFDAVYMNYIANQESSSSRFYPYSCFVVNYFATFSLCHDGL